MKKILSILLFTLTVNYLFSQTDFKWEKIDSVTKTKDPSGPQQSPVCKVIEGC